MAVRLRDVVSNPTQRSGMLPLPYIALENVKAGAGRLVPEAELEELTRSDTAVAHSGDVLFGKLRPYLCKVVHVQNEIQCSTELLVLRTNERYIDNRFLYYLALSKPFVEWAVATSVGVKMPRTDWAKLSQFELAVLPLIEEQHRLVALLDAECCRLDALVDEQRHQRALLLERRHALITAVIDGQTEWLLRPEPFDSEPERYARKPLKALADIRVSNADKKTVEGQTPVLLCNYTDVYNSDDIVTGMEFMPATATQDQLVRLTLRAGDVLFTKDSETPQDIAVPAYVPEDLPGVICGYHLAIVSPRRGIALGRFLFWSMQSKFVSSQFEVAATGVTRYGLRQSTLGDVSIPAPGLAEQERIVALLDHECSRIDTLISELERSEDLLTERKRALITDAVTGQLGVA